MFPQCFVNWIVRFIFRHLKPLVKYAKELPTAVDPLRREDEAVGFDLYATKSVQFGPGEIKVCDTGIVFQIPSYLGLFIWDKSSMGLKGFKVLGGVVDPDYRGRVGVILQNCLSKRAEILQGKPLAQAVFQFVLRPDMKCVTQKDLSESLRGTRGFGGQKIDVLER